MEGVQKVTLGELEIQTTCPWYSLMVAPDDFKEGDPLEFICEDRGKDDCLECLLATIATTLMTMRDMQFTLLKQSQSKSNLFVPTIPTRK
jgi:hypothetical protein